MSILTIEAVREEVRILSRLEPTGEMGLVQQAANYRSMARRMSDSGNYGAAMTATLECNRLSLEAVLESVRDEFHQGTPTTEEV